MKYFEVSEKEYGVLVFKKLENRPTTDEDQKSFKKSASYKLSDTAYVFVTDEGKHTIFARPGETVNFSSLALTMLDKKFKWHHAKNMG